MDTFITNKFNDLSFIVSLITCGVGVLISLAGTFFYFTTKGDIGTKKNLFKIVIKVGLMIAMLSALGIFAVIILK